MAAEGLLKSSWSALASHRAEKKQLGALTGGSGEIEGRFRGGSGEVQGRSLAGHGPLGGGRGREVNFPSPIEASKQRNNDSNRRSEHALGQRPDEFHQGLC